VGAVTQPRMNDREVVRCECAFLLDRKERYRKAAQDYHPRQNPPAGKGTVFLRLSTPEPLGQQRPWGSLSSSGRTLRPRTARSPDNSIVET
jgi:hypothetical protein